jgi:hypothetical protein
MGGLVRFLISHRCYCRVPCAQEFAGVDLSVTLVRLWAVKRPADPSAACPCLRPNNKIKSSCPL